MQFVSGEWAHVPSAQVNRAIPQPANQKISVVLPFIESEIPMVLELLAKSFTLSQQIPRNLILIPMKGTRTEQVMESARVAFQKVGIIHDAEGVKSDWQDRAQMRSAAGPNSLFRQATWHFYLNKGGSWLWLEPDCMPVTPRWLFALEQEYFEAGKPFYGAKMRTADGREYMNGVGIYPWNAVQHAPLLVQSTMWKQHPDVEVGFDIAGGMDVLNRAHITRKIQLMHHLAGSNNTEIRPEVVLVHGRNNLGGAMSGQRSTAESGEEPPAQTICDPDGVPLSSYAKKNPPIEIDSESNGAPSQTKQDGSEYGSITKQIRQHVLSLRELWADQPHRKVLIVKELRRAKLVPKHFR